MPDKSKIVHHTWKKGDVFYARYVMKNGNLSVIHGPYPTRAEASKDIRLKRKDHLNA